MLKKYWLEFTFAGILLLDFVMIGYVCYNFLNP